MVYFVLKLYVQERQLKELKIRFDYTLLTYFDLFHDVEY